MARGGFGDEKTFDQAAGSFSQGEAGGDYFGIVEDEEIGWFQQTIKVRECAVMNCSAGADVMKQAGIGAVFRWGLRDQLRRQFEIQFVRSHFISSLTFIACNSA